MLSSGNSTSRGSTALASPDVHPLPRCLPLEPITLGNQKYTCSGELRRVLGVPPGSATEDHTFGVGHLKTTPPVATKELKNFKESVQDASKKARDRAKKFRESIVKLDNYRKALSSMKGRRTDLLSNAKSGGASLLKMDGQIFRNPHDHPTQRLEDKTKIIGLGLKKRIRTSLLDARAEFKSAAVPRQEIVVEKDRDMLKVGGGGAIHMEEKIQRLPAGGGGWDKKKKRKRSVGVVGNRAINGDRDMKRAMHLKLSADTKLRPIGAQGFRSRTSPGVSGINKLVESFVPTNSTSCKTPSNELEGFPPLRDHSIIIEGKFTAKGNNMPNIIEENPAGSPSRMIKGKVCGTPRIGPVSVTILDSSPDVHLSSGALGGEEQPTNGNNALALGVADNQKRPISTSSFAHHMAQWVGQRPLKISRTRRANLVSPVSNNNEAQISSQGFITSDLSARSPCGTGRSLLVSSIDDNNPKFKIKLENVPSPVALLEGEESGGGEIKWTGKGSDTGEVGVADLKGKAFMLPPRKNKVLDKRETADGVKGQGRIGRFISSTGPVVISTREKIENLPRTKPLHSMRRGLDKSKSKYGHPPSTKLTDHKTSIRAGHELNSGASDFIGDSDDDQEELLAAASYARKAGSLACSGKFWKQMEFYFASVTSQDASFLKHQLNLAEELNGSLSQMLGYEYNTLGGLVHKEDPVYSARRQENPTNSESVETDVLCGGFDTGDKAPPLYQRVLSALIEEDESEELYHQNEGRSMSFQCASDDSHCGSCNHNDVEPKDRDRTESEVESEVDLQAQKHCLLDRISCNKSTSSNTNSNRSVSSSLCNHEQWQVDDGLSCSDAGLVPGNDLVLLHPSQVDVPAIYSSDGQYQMLSLDDRLLLELQSIGLYPEIMPHLAEGEERINQDIMELQAGFYRQVGKMKKNLGKIDKAIPYVRDVERRNMEQVAMNKLIEMAYKKRMACRGSHSSKSVVRRVSNQVALAFAKRTLARCRNFENSGRSCFSQPALQDVIFAAPQSNSDVKSIVCVGSRTASNRHNESSNYTAEPMGSATGAVSSTLERDDSHSDKLHRGSSDAQQAITHSSEEAFFKHEPKLNGGKNVEVLLDDIVGSASSKAASFGEMKGNRSERQGDQNGEMLTRNSVSGTDHPSVGSFRSNCKSKAKPKHNTNDMSTSGNGLGRRFLEATHLACPAARGSSQSMANVKVPRFLSIEKPADFANEQLNELASIDLGTSNGPGEHQDFSSLLDFDEDGLQDHDSMGLEIPMDDLSDLQMFM